MNICFLTKEVPNLRTGGIENVTFTLTQALRRRGHRVSWITVDESTRLSVETDDHLSIGNNGDFTRTIDCFIKDNEIEIVINQAVEFRLHQAVEYLRKSFKYLKFAKVLHTDPLYLIKGVRDKESLFCEKGFVSRAIYKLSPTTRLRRYRRHKYTRSLYLKWLATYDKIVLLSSEYIKDFLIITKTKNQDSIVSIANPIDIKQCINIGDKEKVVLYVGRLHREAKRPDRLLEVWRMIYSSYPDWKLIIVGDGPMKNKLKEYSNNNNIKNIEFVGQTNPLKYYNMASIVCLTSTYEGFPVVCTEALGSGAIPIAFESFGAVKDLIRDKVTGILVSPYNVNEYARKLESLMDNDNERKRMQENIANDHEFKSKFSIDTIISEWERLFEELTQ